MKANLDLNFKLVFETVIRRVIFPKYHHSESDITVSIPRGRFCSFANLTYRVNIREVCYFKGHYSKWSFFPK